jgi:hypothetical protein
MVNVEPPQACVVDSSFASWELMNEIVQVVT